jgi:hypothetical protein
MGHADIDGFKLLEIIGLEMDIPVISAVPRYQADFHSAAFSCLTLVIWAEQL